MEHEETTQARVRARDAAMRLLNRLTTGAALSALLGVGVFGAISAQTIPGTSITATASTSTASSSSSSSSSGSSVTSSSSSALQSSTTPVSSSSSSGVAVSGGS